MSGSAPDRPDLVDHPLVSAAHSLPTNCTVNASFRTYDPESRSLKPLQNARVNLVPNVGASYAGETDGSGNLHVPGSPGVFLVIPDLQDLPQGVEFHFEIVGPTLDPNGDLTAMSYPVGNAANNFPIAMWSTKGWKEPEGYWGHFKLTDTTFPLLPLRRNFTVGCYVNVAVRYVRSTTRLPSPVPENILLSLVRNSTAKPATPLRPGGIFSDVFFDIMPGDDLVPGDKIEVHGVFQTAAIQADNITPVIGGLTIGNSIKGIVPGELFGFPILQNVGSINLYSEYEFADSTLSAVVQIAPMTPRLEYAAYANNVEGHYNNLDLNQKLCVCYNWFIELVARRNLYIRAMKYFFAYSSITWDGLLALTLDIHDGSGGASTAGDQMIVNLQHILGPRDFVVPHELTHSLVDQYFSSLGSNIYYPARTTSHWLQSYSNEFFAFQEGFTQFVAGLFLNPVDVFVPGSAAALFTYQSPPGPWKVTFGRNTQGPDVDIADDKLEGSAGMALESAFAGALLNFWATCLWKPWAVGQPGNNWKSWVQDSIGEGTLDPGAPNSPNGWLVNTDLQKQFAFFIVDAVVAANSADEWGQVASRTSTRRVVDQIQKQLTSITTWPGISWLAVNGVFDDFRVRNEFYVSSITKPFSFEYIIVRSSEADFEYAAIDGDALFSDSGRRPIVISKSSDNSLTIRGIRFPQTLSCSLVAQAPLLNPGLPVVGTVTRTSEYQAEVLFEASQLTPVGTGPYALLFETDPLQLQPANQKFLITSVKVQG